MKLAILGALAALVLPAAARAQASYVGPQNRYAWSSGLGSSGAFGKVLAGDFDGDKQTDLIIKRDTNVYAVAGAWAFGTQVNISESCTDFDVVRGGASNGCDALITSGSAGLKLIQFTNTFATKSTTALMTNGNWQNARAVRVCDLDGDSTKDVAIITQNGGYIRIAYDVAGGSVTSTAEIASSSTLVQIEPMQWASSGPQHLAVLTNAGFNVYSAGGTAQLSSTLGYVGDSGCIAIMKGATIDRVNIVVRNTATPPEQIMRVIDSTGIEPEVNIGSYIAAIAATTADMDCDGDADLLVSHQYSTDAVVAQNRTLMPPGSPYSPIPQGPAYAVSDPWVFVVPQLTTGTVVPNSGNFALPYFGDLDDDMCADIGFPFVATGTEGDTLQVMHNTLGDASLPPIVVRPNGLTVNKISGSSPFQAVLSLSLPTTIPMGATHLHVKMWPRSSTTATVAGTATEIDGLYSLSGHTSSATLTLDLVNETSNSFSTIYDLQIRMVGYDSQTSKLTKGLPTWSGSFTMSAAAFSSLHQNVSNGMDSYAIEQPVSGPWNAVTVPSGTTPTSKIVGGVVPRPNLPIFTGPPSSAGAGGSGGGGHLGT